MDSTQRKTLLYRSGLGFWCVNHVQGCSHGCRYPCYAFMMARHHGRARDMEEWCRPKLVDNALELLEKELRRRRAIPISCVHLCLTTDPFMVGYPEVTALSLQIIAAINRHRIACSVLTKGRLPEALGDPTRFRRDNTYGISIVSVNEAFRRQWEPGAAPYAERIAAARALHFQGCHTLAHIEPYPTANILKQDILTLLEPIGFVNELFFSGWNYNRQATEVSDRDRFYQDQARIVRRFCADRGIGYDGINTL